MCNIHISMYGRIFYKCVEKGEYKCTIISDSVIKELVIVIT